MNILKKLTKLGMTLSLLGLLAFPAFAEEAGILTVLQQISASVNQVSTQLTQMAQMSQQNWNHYFRLEVSAQFSPESYPEWQSMQGDFSTIQSNFNAGALNNLVSQASQHLYNPDLSAYLSEVDQVSLNTAGSAISQLNQGTQGPAAITDAVSLPLSSAWQQDLANASPIQVLKAISAQTSTNNALLYKLWQQDQTQEVLLSRLLLEMTELNQNIRQLNATMLSRKAN